MLRNIRNALCFVPLIPVKNPLKHDFIIHLKQALWQAAHKPCLGLIRLRLLRHRSRTPVGGGVVRNPHRLPRRRFYSPAGARPEAIVKNKKSRAGFKRQRRII
jgi:hypothetical protein